MLEELQNFARHIWERYLSKTNFPKLKETKKRADGINARGNCKRKEEGRRGYPNSSHCLWNT